MSIPKYINCRNREIEDCDYFMHKDCKETCAYAKYIRGTVNFEHTVTEEDEDVK